MAVINVERSNGEKQVVTATAGQSVMEALRNAGIDEILAICGAAARARRVMCMSTIASWKNCRRWGRTRTIFSIPQVIGLLSRACPARYA